MAPILDERELSVPRITRITRPFQMEKLSSDNITVVVDTVKKAGSSAKDDELRFRFRAVDNLTLPVEENDLAPRSEFAIPGQNQRHFFPNQGHFLPRQGQNCPGQGQNFRRKATLAKMT